MMMLMQPGQPSYNHGGGGQLNNVSKMRKELKKEQRRLEMQQAYLLEQQERKRVNDMIKRNQIKKWQQTRASGASIPSQHVPPYSQAPQKGGGYEYEERLNSNIHKYFSPNVGTDESAGEETEMTDSLFGGYKQGGNSFTSKQQVVKGAGGQSNSRFNGNNIHKTGVSAPPAMGSGPGELDSEDEIF